MRERDIGRQTQRERDIYRETEVLWATVHDMIKVEMRSPQLSDFAEASSFTDNGFNK